MKTIGVLGGMGPQASVRFYEKLVSYSNEIADARDNRFFPQILINSLVVKDMISDRDNKDETVGIVAEGAQVLQRAGAEFVVMSCNTMHLFEDRITKGLQVPFLSLVKAVSDKVKESGYKKVGLLGSKTMLDCGLYEVFLKDFCDLILPNEDERDRLSDVIKDVIAGQFSVKDRAFLDGLINEMIVRGADAIILGCTELPLVITQNDCEVPVVDSLDVLARRAVKFSMGV